MSGGAGYVLSRQSVQLVAPILEEQSDFIGQGAVVEGQQTRPNASAMEDVQIGWYCVIHQKITSALENYTISLMT